MVGIRKNTDVEVIKALALVTATRFPQVLAKAKTSEDFRNLAETCGHMQETLDIVARMTARQEAQ